MSRENNERSLRILPYICGIIILLLIPACKKKIETTHRAEAIDLYSKSVKLLRVYIDSFKTSPDSSTLYEMNERFNSKFTSLNFKYPSETCLDISEGENDTLSNLTLELVAVRDSLLFLYAHRAESSDSISSDSITLNNTPN